MKTDNFEVVFAIVNSGYADDVMAVEITFGRKDV